MVTSALYPGWYGADAGHGEFHRVDLEKGWEVPAGYPAGIEQKILSGGLDEEHRQGARTRLLRFRRGARTSEQFVHDYWEEVFLVSGDLIVGSPGDERETFTAHT